MIDFSQYGILPQKGRKYEGIVYVLALIYGLMYKEIDAYFAKHNTTSPKYNILMLVAFQNEGKGISQVELAKGLITTAGNVTKLVDSLAKDKLVTRVQNKNNRRENIIKVTAKGKDFVEKLWPGYDSLVKTRTDLISQADQEKLAEILKNWFISLNDANRSK